jgi:hypothetical protein
LTYSGGSYTNSTSATLAVEVQYNLIWNNSVSGATYINVNGIIYSLTQFNSYVMTNSGTFLLPAGQSFTIYNQNSSSGLILQTSSSIVITILAVGPQGPTGPTTATNIAGGIASQIPYQTAPSTTAFIPNGTAGQVLTSNGTSVPTWVSKAYVYTTLLITEPAQNTTYAVGAVMFGGLVQPYLTVKSTAGLTNSGTNGWVRTATVGAQGRFYSPTTSQWLVNLSLFFAQSGSAGSVVSLQLFNSSNVLQSTRNCVVASFVGTCFAEYTCILEMNAGDYFQFIPTVLPIQVFFNNETQTSLQVREL